jgi:curved DNA-binding protein CbpA
VKSLGEMTHYEVLDLPRGASRAEIERAYALASTAFARQSMAHYSVYSDAESEAIGERVELAWRVLADPEARARYDATLAAPAAPPASPTPLLELEPASPRAAPEIAPRLRGLDDPEDESDGAQFGGARLRRARLRRGIELESVAETTKINPTYLRFLEEEYWAGLPAPVYVRGFVAAYARCVGLDPQAVAASYMQRHRAAREAADGRSRRRR